MDGLIERRTEPKREPHTEVEKHDRVWGEHRVEEPRVALPQEDARRRDFERAKVEIRRRTYVQVVDLIQAMPSMTMQMYLLAEQDDQNRDEVLRFFPKPGAMARERYEPFMTDKTAVVGA